MKNKVGRLGRSVSIIGVGYTPMGDTQKNAEIKDLTDRELFAWAALEAMEDAGVEAKDIDAFFAGTCSAAHFSGQMGWSAGLSDWIGMRNKPSFSHDEACATSNVGLHLAVMAVASGAYDVVLSGATNVIRSTPIPGHPPHMRESRHDFPYYIRAQANDAAYSYPGSNVLTPTDAAIVSYIKKYGLTIEQIWEVMNKAAMISREHGVKNPKALYAKETFDEEAKRLGYDDAAEYMRSESNPALMLLQRRMHSSMASDGASAVIVCESRLAKQIHQQPIEVIGFAGVTSMANHQVGTPFKCEQIAFSKAYEMAGIKDPRREVEYMGIHDCSAQHYFTVTEAAGYFAPGEGWKAVRDGRIAYNGDKPVNTSGGRLNLGHPLAGANGVEIAEAVHQMRGKAGPRQMSRPPSTAVIHALGGGWYVNATVLRRL